MPTTDPLKRTVPVDSDAPDLGAILRGYSLSDVGIVKVASRTEADQVRTAYTTAGGTQPVVVWRTDVKNLEIHPNDGLAGSDWEYLAGRQHGATVALSTANLREARDDVVFVSAFTRASAGWSVTADNMNVVIPTTGMYLFDVSGKITGTAGDLGRVYTQFRINDTTLKGRQGVQAEDIVHASLLYPMSAGDQVKIEMYHATGGTRGFDGEMNIAQINSPRW